MRFSSPSPFSESVQSNHDLFQLTTLLPYRVGQECNPRPPQPHGPSLPIRHQPILLFLQQQHTHPQPHERLLPIRQPIILARRNNPIAPNPRLFLIIRLPHRHPPSFLSFLSRPVIIIPPLGSRNNRTRTRRSRSIRLHLCFNPQPVRAALTPTGPPEPGYSHPAHHVCRERPQPGRVHARVHRAGA